MSLLETIGPGDQINVRSLQTMVSGFRLVLGLQLLKTRMQNAYVDVRCTIYYIVYTIQSISYSTYHIVCTYVYTCTKKASYSLYHMRYTIQHMPYSLYRKLYTIYVVFEVTTISRKALRRAMPRFRLRFSSSNLQGAPGETSGRDA